MTWSKISLICTVNLFFEYIKYRWNAKGRHGTHSPFVYDFVDKCLKIEIDPRFKTERENLFKKLKIDSRKITIQDFGAGSKRLGAQRKISALYRTSSSKGKFGDLLYKVSKHYKPMRILEFGTSLGIGTIHLSKGNPEAKISTVEACTETRKEALKNFEKLDCKNILSYHSTFSDFLKSQSEEIYDLVFIDGHHDGTALLAYLQTLEKFTHNDTIFILDDIRWSTSMFEAWKSIESSDEYHVTMDLFRMGIVLKRTQQEKEQFTISI